MTRAAEALTSGAAPTRRVRAVLGAVLLTTFLAALDQTVVGPAMPRILAQLQGLDRYAWVFTAYMLAQTASTPIWGKLSDLYGRKPYYAGGLLVFLLGSLLSGLSQSMDQLIVCRALQGLGAGAMLPVAQAIIADIFAPAERARYQGMAMAAYTLASVAGPAIGGTITDRWDWHWVFFINLPLGIVTLAVGLTVLPYGATRSGGIDYAGAALLAAGVIPLLLAFTWAGSSYAWLSPQILGLLGAAGALLLAFVLVERRSAEPIMPLSLFANPIFAIAALATAVASVGLFGGTFYLGLFVQGVLGQSATSSGVVATPTTVGAMIGGIVGGQIVSRWGHYRPVAIAGIAIATAGMLLLTGMSGATSLSTVAFNMVVFGLGIGTVIPLFTVVVQNAVDRRVIGAATATLAFVRSISGTIGVAILGALLTAVYNREFLATVPSTVAEAVPAGRLAAFSDPQILLSSQARDQIATTFAPLGGRAALLMSQLLETVRQALGVAIHDVFLACSVMLAVALALCFLLREIPLERHGPSPAHLPSEPS